MKKRLIKIIKSKRNITVVVVAIVALLFVFQTQVNQSKPAIQSAKVKQGDIREELILSGEIDADEQVTLRFQTSGKLAYVNVKEGQFVKKGQAIASLDRIELQKRLNKQLNTFLSERYDFDQTKDDNKDKAVTDAIRRTLDKSQNDLDNSIIDVELQKISLDLATLISPISGFVTSITTPLPGVNITPAQAEFVIVNPNTLIFTSTADQTEVIKLSNDLEAKIRLDSFPEETLSGKINNISFTPKSGETGTAYEIKVTLNQQEIFSKLRIGMTGDVSFITRISSDALYLPIRYVKLSGEKPFVFIKKNNKIVKKNIDIGIETEDKIEIKLGLEKGDTVYDKNK